MGQRLSEFLNQISPTQGPKSIVNNLQSISKPVARWESLAYGAIKSMLSLGTDR